MTRDRGRIIETLELGHKAARAFLAAQPSASPASSSLLLDAAALKRAAGDDV
jgi:hypothetical protein